MAAKSRSAALAAEMLTVNLFSLNWEDGPGVRGPQDVRADP